MASKIVVLLAMAGLILGVSSAYGQQGVVPTGRSVDFYGYATDFSLEPGDTVSAYSASGFLCGECTVRQSGAYGFLHVYGDDPSTPQVEGARPGETITLKVNGVPVAPADPDQPVWTGDGDKHHVDLRQ